MITTVGKVESVSAALAGSAAIIASEVETSAVALKEYRLTTVPFYLFTRNSGRAEVSGNCEIEAREGFPTESGVFP
jgi:hypothetical protein